MRTALTSLACLCVATTLAAQNANEVAAMSCQQTAAKQMRAEHPEADSVRLTPNPAVSEKARGEALVQGSGQYFDRGSRQWRRFTYECTYRTRSAKTAVTLQL
jgi:hypothetical protein